MGHHHHSGQDHDHSGHHHATGNIAIAFFLNLGFTIFEIFGGFYVNSVAILSDALHDLGDSFSLGLSWYLEKKSANRADIRYTFGYKRFSILGALANSLILIIGSGFVVYHAVERLIHPEPSNAKGMLVFALVGIIVNGFAAWKLSKGGNLNQKVLSWHLIEDILGWTAILIAGTVMLFIEIQILDPLLSLVITAYVLFNVINRLKETLYIFLQGAPHHVDLGELKNKILSIPNVKSIHHTHLWSLDEANQVFTIHVSVNNITSLTDVASVKQQIKEHLKDLKISHATIDIELEEEECYMEKNDH